MFERHLTCSSSAAISRCLLALTMAIVGGCDDAGGSTGPAAIDAGPTDAGLADAGLTDAGLTEAGLPDAGLTDAAPVDPGPRPTVDDCFAGILGELAPDYAQFDPVIGYHCAGTDHQDVQGVERVVFLGDSVTTGTPPARLWEWYRALLTDRFHARYGEDLPIDNCSAFGARTDDLLIGKRQIPECFPDDGDDRTTLVVFTVGGNDIAAWAQDHLSAAEAMQAASDAADLLDEALAWFREPGRFPNGVFLVFANPYEFTDGTGDLESCALAAAVELSGNWIEGAPAVLNFQERFMRAAVAHGFDLVFSLEHFCGHGFHHDDPASQCYRGPDTPVWFDFTCIHPNTVGHRALADLFWSTITDEPIADDTEE